MRENRGHKRRYTKFEEHSLFSGLVTCKDCGAVMTLLRTHGESARKARFVCSNYRKNSKTTCSIHGIREEDFLQELKGSTSNFDRFLDNAHKYTEINELTPELLHTFIKRIEVGERAKRYSRRAPQDIIIHYRDIGILNDMPQDLEDILHQVAEMDGDVTYALQEPVWDAGS